jgi:mono/diheme cytochrome c family protein
MGGMPTALRVCIMRQFRIGALVAIATMIGVADVYAQASSSEFGEKEYLRSCAVCHGRTGKGDGPIAESLNRRPTDLTKLSEGNKGVFPFARTYEVVDGRFNVMVHGPRDMPVWGDVYTREMAARAPRDTPREFIDGLARARILALVEYIFTLQSK